MNAFPDRVAAFQFDLAATGRLAFRLKKKFDLERSAQQLLDALLPAIGTAASPGALEVWPGGPPAGVYLTTSEAAIKALLERYEEATDGALVYAERAGSHHAGSIDLGENGLWSSGLERVASGTLLVLGPVELDQQSWEEAGQRLLAGCLRAGLERHRVAVLVDTPTSDTLFEDARLAVRSASAQANDDIDSEIVGAVDKNGELVVRPTPTFQREQQIPSTTPTIATLDALPPEAVDPLRRALAARPAGLLLFGHSEITEHPAIEQVAASLVLTDFAGPAARIMPRHRGTPTKDWMVPEPIKALPFLASIHSAYAQGYRRMLIDMHYTKSGVILAYPDVLFIGGTYGHDVSDVARFVLLSAGADDRVELGARLIASLGLLQVSTKRGVTIAPDLVVMPPTPPPPGMRFAEFEEFLLTHRQLRWEDKVEHLLATRACSVAQLKKALPRNRHLATFLAQRREATETASPSSAVRAEIQAVSRA